MNLSKTFLAILIMVLLLGGFLFWRNSPEAFVHQQGELIGQKQVILFSSLEFENQTVEEGDIPQSFPADLISIEQAIQNVIQKYPGRVTRAELLFGERGPIYEVAVQGGDGSMTVIEVEAETEQGLGPFSELDRDSYPGKILDHETEI